MFIFQYFILAAVMLLTCIKQTSALSFNVTCDPAHVQTNVNKDSTLTCHVVPPKDLSDEMVKWTLKWELENKVVHIRRNGQDDSKQGRTRLLKDKLEEGVISLIISNTSAEDEGTYTCLVAIDDENGQLKEVGTVKLKVTNEDPKGQFGASTVTPPPDTPTGAPLTTTEKVLLGLGIPFLILLLGAGGVLIWKRDRLCTRVEDRAAVAQNEDDDL